MDNLGDTWAVYLSLSVNSGYLYKEKIIGKDIIYNAKYEWSMLAF